MTKNPHDCISPLFHKHNEIYQIIFVFLWEEKYKIINISKNSLCKEKLSTDDNLVEPRGNLKLSTNGNLTIKCDVKHSSSYNKTKVVILQ